MPLIFPVFGSKQSSLRSTKKQWLKMINFTKFAKDFRKWNKNILLTKKVVIFFDRTLKKWQYVRPITVGTELQTSLLPISVRISTVPCNIREYLIQILIFFHFQEITYDEQKWNGAGLEDRLAFSSFKNSGDKKLSQHFCQACGQKILKQVYFPKLSKKPTNCTLNKQYTLSSRWFQLSRKWSVKKHESS